MRREARIFVAMTTDVEVYFLEGCGRCALGGTPQCKVHTWAKELAQLRRILRECGLTEECKWGAPCYTVQGKNIVIIGSFREYCSLMFFKGALLQDSEGILTALTENMHVGRMIQFTDYRKILALEPVLKAYLYEAIEVEKAGLKVASKPVSEYAFPEELQRKLDEDPAFKSAFEALTPGRQKGYLLHFSAAKQAKTREARIEKCLPLIFAGKGLNE